MSRIIKLNAEIVKTMVKEFEDIIKKAKLSDGKISYSKSFACTNKKTKVIFEELAWLKMQALVDNFDKEVAWHGIAKRCEEGYLISDILVYPQEVTSATVDTDQAEYEKWLMELDDETFNNLRMQGHSHVRMGTSPSGTDLTHQGKILDQLKDDMFYIFMIWNKLGNRDIKIYDYKDNTLYENGDIEVVINDDNLIVAFTKNAKEMVKDKVYTSPKATEEKKDKEKKVSEPTKSAVAKTSKPKRKSGGGVYGSYGSSYGNYYDTYYGNW